MPVRGIRGATVATANTREAILEATGELLVAIIEANHLQQDDVVSMLFTATPDLDAEFPALAARQMGWLDAALMCAQEIPVPNRLGHAIRVLIHWNTERRPEEVVHVYLREAVHLRPDRARNGLDRE